MFRRSSAHRFLVITGLLSSILALSISSSIAHATDGHTDESFGSSGVASVSIAPSGDTTADVAVQSDGKIIVAGSGSFPAGSGSYDFVLTRFDTDGSLDTSFSGDGVVNTDLNSNSTDELTAIVLQGDGKILATGWSSYGGGTYAVIARYNTDGSLDTSFDGDGKLFLTSQNPSSEEIGHDILVQPDGKIVIVGQSFDIAANLSEPFVIRVSSDGTSTDFITVIDSTQSAVVNAGALQPDGKILLAGVLGSSSQKLALWRVNSSGQIDLSFGISGKVETAQASSAQSIALQSDGKIVVGGITGTSAALNSAILRYTADGVLDSTFSGDGIYENSFSNEDDYINDLVLRPTGQIVAVGAVKVNNFERNLILQLTSSGALDTTFSSDGFQFVAVGSNESRGIAAAIQNDGKVLVAAFAYFGSTADLAVLRLNPPSTVATLSGLSVTNTSLAQTFSSNTTSYTASVANTTTSITITPTTTNTYASAKVNGIAVASGSASGAISLAVGVNNIPVVVTAQNGTTQTTYTITVTRAAAPAVDSSSGSTTDGVTTTTSPSTTTTVAAKALPTVKVKRTISAKSILVSRDITLSSTSKVVITVKTSSKKYCSVSGTKVLGVKKGNCTVVVAVTPKATKTVKKPKTTKTTVTIRVV